MLSLGTKRTGGFKVAIGRKANYGYQLAVIVMAGALLGLVIYDILYASRSFSSVFNEQLLVEPVSHRFNLEAAENNSRLTGVEPSPAELQDLEEIFPDFFSPSPSVVATSTPEITE